jgi:uncharacterized protein (TIGR00730 family)
MQRLCVFCGSSVGLRAIYSQAAKDLGTEMARRGIGLVYGGGNVGLMGILADAVLAGGAEVHGVIPGALRSRELAHQGLTHLDITPSMHARKERMVQLSEGFVALPGGFGTYDELFEVMTWSQLGIHERPIGVLDVDGYFAPFAMLVDKAIAEGFVKRDFAELVVRESDVGRLIDRMKSYAPIKVQKWVSLPEA